MEFTDVWKKIGELKYVNEHLIMRLFSFCKSNGEIKAFEVTKNGRVILRCSLREPKKFEGFDTAQGGKVLVAYVDNEQFYVNAKEDGLSHIEVGEYEQHLGVFTMNGKINSFHVRTRTAEKQIKEISYEEDKSEAKLHLY